MFVERISDRTVEEFIESQFTRERNWKMSIKPFRSGNEWWGSVENWQSDNSLNYRLEDFNTGDSINTKAWTKYLHSIFGEEYKNAFVEMMIKNYL